MLLSRKLFRQNTIHKLLSIIIPMQIIESLGWHDKIKINMYLDQEHRQLVLEEAGKSRLPIFCERKLYKSNYGSRNRQLNIPYMILSFLGFERGDSLYLFVDEKTHRLYIYKHFQSEIKAPSA